MRILIISSIDISLLRFRGKLIQRLISEGHEVVLVAPEFGDETKEALSAYGATTLTVPMHPTGMNAIEDFKTLKALKRVIANYEIDLVFSYNLKPVIYGSLAAAFNKVKAISLITGLGFGFSKTSVKSYVINVVLKQLYRVALRKNAFVIFQNKNDLELFQTGGLIPSDMLCKVVNGSGVDLAEFAFREKRPTEKIRFVFVGRLIKEKGVKLFIDAAENLRENWPNAEFHVLGGIQPNSPSGLAADEINQYVEKGVITFHGRRNDILEFLPDCDVFVLPTYYREGVPRSILEALSIGMPVITTDTPGCRETVVDGRNGYLIPPQDLEMLVSTMEAFLKNENLIAQMGRQSRAVAEEKFDVHSVNDDIVEVIDSYREKVDV